MSELDDAVWHLRMTLSVADQKSQRAIDVLVAAIPAVGGGSCRDDIAQLLWQRFAPVHHIGWQDETHKAEYLLAADDVLSAIASPISRPHHSPEQASVLAELQNQSGINQSLSEGTPREGVLIPSHHQQVE